MAIAAAALWNIQASGGSDTQCSGSFDTTQTAGMDAVGQITSPNTASPVISSANYTFQAADVGADVYLPPIAPITGTYAGWYTIASVSAGAATLTAGVGTATIKNTFQLNTIAGVSSSGSTLTGVTWTIDYSILTSAGTGIALTWSTTGSGSTGTVITVGAGGLVQLVGNGLVITGGGATSTLGYFTIQSVSGTGTGGTFTCDRAISTGAVISGTGFYGGPLATWGMLNATGQYIGGQTVTIKSGAYSMTTTTASTSGGPLVMPAGATGTSSRLLGYQTTRGDYAAQPVMTASGVSGTYTMVTANSACIIDNVAVNGATLGTVKGFSIGSGSDISRSKASNCTNGGIIIGKGFAFNCYATTNTTVAAFECTGNAGGIFSYCLAQGNSTIGFLHNNDGVCDHCIADNNSGVTTDNFQTAAMNVTYINCTSTRAGRAGYRVLGGGSNFNLYLNCLAEANTGYGFDAATVYDNARYFNCGTYNNNSGGAQFNLTNIDQTNIFNWINNTTGTFFVSLGTNFGLNNTANQGALARGAALPGAFPGLSTTIGYGDLGAVQSQASGGSSGGLIPVNLSGGIRG